METSFARMPSSTVSSFKNSRIVMKIVRWNEQSRFLTMVSRQSNKSINHSQALIAKWGKMERLNTTAISLIFLYNTLLPAFSLHLRKTPKFYNWRMSKKDCVYSSMRTASYMSEYLVRRARDCVLGWEGHPQSENDFQLGNWIVELCVFHFKQQTTSVFLAFLGELRILLKHPIPWDLCCHFFH